MIILDAKIIDFSELVNHFIEKDHTIIQSTDAKIFHKNSRSNQLNNLEALEVKPLKTKV